MTELGFPSVNATIWYGLMAPTGTPRNVIVNLNAEANRILKLPGVIERMAGAGIDAQGSTPEAFGLPDQPPNSVGRIPLLTYRWNVE